MIRKTSEHSHRSLAERMPASLKKTGAALLAVASLTSLEGCGPSAAATGTPSVVETSIPASQGSGETSTAEKSLRDYDGNSSLISEWGLYKKLNKDQQDLATKMSWNKWEDVSTDPELKKHMLWYASLVESGRKPYINEYLKQSAPEQYAKIMPLAAVSKDNTGQEIIDQYAWSSGQSSMAMTEYGDPAITTADGDPRQEGMVLTSMYLSPDLSGNKYYDKMLQIRATDTTVADGTGFYKYKVIAESPTTKGTSGDYVKRISLENATAPGTEGLQYEMSLVSFTGVDSDGKDSEMQRWIATDIVAPGEPGYVDLKHPAN